MTRSPRLFLADGALDESHASPNLEPVLYWVIKAILTPVLRGLYRIRIEGREHVPERGPVILAANHRSFMDSIFLPLVIRRRVTFVAKAEYFDDRKTAWFFRGVGQIPIRREGGSASDRALASATEVLEQGGVFGIYPEGTRTRDGYLHRGHTGVARLALRTGAPIVPVGMVGTDEIQPTDKKLPRVLRTLRINFGAPISVERYADQEHDRMALRQITDEVMFEIQQLSGYEYVDTYATKKAEDVPTEPVPLATLETRTAAVA
jgi:1-acyl-sn-glycerol-3-phosphate acyltransferase